MFQDDLECYVKEMCGQFGTQKWIANLGHGIYPDVDPANMEVFVKAVQKYSAQTQQ